MSEQHPTLLGPYEVLNPLGQGGMGIVYLARHRASGQEVALKTLKVAKESFLRSLRREIDALASLKHPGIVRILDQGLTPKEGLPWYAMELVPGKNLRQWRDSLSPPSKNNVSPNPTPTQYPTEAWWTTSLSKEQLTISLSPDSSEPASVLQEKEPNILSEQITEVNLSSNSPMSESTLYPPIEAEKIGEVLQVTGQLCLSLAYLHGKGIVHRDLKPENILIRPEGGSNAGQPVLVDFGLASLWGSRGEDSREHLGESTIERSLLGTPYYMSPEQIQGLVLDARSDLYSLGVLLFELLCGRHPLLKKTLEATLAAHLLDTPSKPSKWVSHLSEELETLLLSLLAKDKQKRPGYAEDVARTLFSLQTDSDSISAWPSPRPYLYRPRLIGRNTLLTQLREHLDRWEEGEGGLVLLGGESGVGKTRLVMEVVQQWSQEKRTKRGVWIGECEDEQTFAPLSAFRKILQAIEDRCRAQGLEETERILGKRGPLLADYQTTLSSLPGQEHYPAPHGLAPKEARLRLFFALSETLDAFSKPKPFVLVLDDLQWADELSLDFLQFLLQKDDLCRKFMVLGTYRSEESTEKISRLLTEPNVSFYPVPRLKKEAVSEMVGDMLVISPPPKKLSHFLATQSEGNPFFVAEYLRTAVEEGLLFRNSSGKWQVIEDVKKGGKEIDYSKLGLPRSLKDLVARWLNGLSPSAREWMFTAAVLGRESSLEVLEILKPAELRGLHELLAREVLAESRIGWIRFTHDKLREGALAQLPATKKPQLHRRVATVLEQLADSREGFLGYHWEQAGEIAKAQEYYLKGARRASQNYSHQEAEKYYRTYLSLVETTTLESIKVRNELGYKVLLIQGKPEEAAKEHTKALEASRQLGSRNSEGQSLAHLGVVFRKMGRLKDAKPFYEKALAIAQEQQDQPMMGRVLGNLASLYWVQGEYKEAQKFYEQALLIQQAAGNKLSEGVTLGNLANLYSNQRGYQEAQSLYERSIAIVRAEGAQISEGVALANLANLHHGQGQYEKAQPLYEQALSIMRKVGDKHFEGITLGNIATVKQEQGQYEEAQKFYTQALTLLRMVKEPRFEGVYLRDLGDMTRRYQGDLVQGETFLSQAAPLLANTPIELGRWFCAKGHLALASQKSASSFLTKAKAIAQKMNIIESGEFGKRLARLVRAQQAFDAQKSHLLFRGELWTDIPVQIRKWLQSHGQGPSQNEQLI